MSAALTELANKYQSDKGTEFGERHGYTQVYEQLFAPRREQPLRLLEIGLRYDPYYADVSQAFSPSLQMWLDYFPQGKVFGFDINDFTKLRGERLQVLRGDQGNPEDLRRVARQLAPFDIIIDDGSHASFHQQLTFALLFPCVRPGGLYVIEDLHWQPPSLEASLPRVPKTRDVVRLLMFQAFGEVRLYCDNKLCVVRCRDVPGPGGGDGG
jgi:hypothetical protein